MSIVEEDKVIELRPGDSQVRTLPHNTEVEAALLGAILANNEAFAQVTSFLKAEHFFEPIHGRIFDTIARQLGAGNEVSPLTIKHLFEHDEDLAELGGAGYLYDMATAVISVVSAKQYGETILSLYQARHVIGLYETQRDDLYNGVIENTREAVETTIDALYKVIETGFAGPGVKHFGAILDETIKEIDRDRRGESPVGLITGMEDLDRLFTAMMPGDMTILGARPGMGKTAFAWNVARNVARTGEPVYFQSLEMGATQIGRRDLAGRSNMATNNLIGRKTQALKQAQMEALMRAATNDRNLPMWVDDSPYVTVADIHWRAKKVKERHGLSLIVVDYLQLIKASAEARRKGNDTSEMTETSRALKTLAKDLDVHVLALSQLSRNLESRSNKRPILADLRQSGSIEQDADNVLFLYREQYYLEQAMESKSTDDQTHAQYMAAQARLDGVRGIAEAILAKQRQGPTGKVDLKWNGEQQQFSDLSQREDMH